MSYRVVVLKGDVARRYSEKVAAGTITPGDLLIINSAEKYLRHDTYNGKWGRWVALENSLAGLNTIDTDYAADEIIRACCLEPGDVIAGNLKAGQNVAVSDMIVSNGDGKLAKAASEVLANIVADSATLTSWTTAVAFSNGTVSIPANSMKAGDVYRIRGRVSVPSTNSTDTMTGTVNLGSTALLTTAALNVTNDDAWLFDVLVTVRTVGASGTYVASGLHSFGVLASASTPFVSGIVNSTAIDTTAANSITIKMACSVSSSGNQAILRELNVSKVVYGGAVASGVEVVGRTRTALDLSASLVNGRIELELF